MNKRRGGSSDRGPVTIIDVARLAQVSVGTVSNVLNGTYVVGEVRRKRVLDAIDVLGFQQNLLAQGLRRQSSSVVGLCVPLTSTSYFAALVDAFEEVAWSRNFAIMQVLTRQDPLVEHQRIQQLLRYRVGGLLLVPSVAPEESYDLISKSGVPLVVVDRPMRHRPVDQVVFANRDAMHQLGQKLIAMGHHRILFCVQQPDLSVTIERREGLNQAVAESAKPVVAQVLVSATTKDAFLEQIRAELNGETPPTVIIVSNSLLAGWIVSTLQILGVRYPQQVSVVSFGETEWAEFVSPSLSVVRQPTREIATRAWELLIRRMHQEEMEPTHLELEGEIILRDSVAPPPEAAVAPARKQYC